ncbi:hypothetical protein BH11ACT3_BH11ACT3_22130 [soil metagenome]
MLSVPAALISVLEEAPAPLIASPFVFAGIAAAIFIVLGFVTWSYRDVSNRHSGKGDNADHQSSQH